MRSGGSCCCVKHLVLVQKCSLQALYLFFFRKRVDEDGNSVASCLGFRFQKAASMLSLVRGPQRPLPLCYYT